PHWPTTSKSARSSRLASPSRRRTSSSASATRTRLVLTLPIIGYAARYRLATMTKPVWSGILWAVALRCLLVDDSPRFLEAASKLLVGEGLAVAGVASTSAEALARVRELEPDVTIVDVDLNGESGFDLAWQLAARSAGPAATRTILTSTHSEADFAELVAVTPVLGFTSKSELSADGVR